MYHLLYIIFLWYRWSVGNPRHKFVSKSVTTTKIPILTEKLFTPIQIRSAHAQNTQTIQSCPSWISSKGFFTLALWTTVLTGLTGWKTGGNCLVNMDAFTQTNNAAVTLRQILVVRYSISRCKLVITKLCFIPWTVPLFYFIAWYNMRMLLCSSVRWLTDF